jgi:hypothetical protein
VTVAPIAVIADDSEIQKDIDMTTPIAPSISLSMTCLTSVGRSSAARSDSISFAVVDAAGELVFFADDSGKGLDAAVSAARASLVGSAPVDPSTAFGQTLPRLENLENVVGAVGVGSAKGYAREIVRETVDELIAHEKRFLEQV